MTLPRRTFTPAIWSNTSFWCPRRRRAFTPP
jgi:hypothetical protein